MAKITTEISLDRIRQMRLGYKVVKEFYLNQDLSSLTHFQFIEYLVYLALKEDDPNLLQSKIEDFMDEYGFDYINNKLDEVLLRDMPDLFDNLSTSEIDKLEMAPIDSDDIPK